MKKNKNMDYLEAIVEIKNVVPPEFINKIITLTNHKAKNQFEVGHGLDISTRNVKGHHLTFNTPTDLFYWNYIKTEIERIYIFYKAKFPKMSSHIINQIDLLKYSVGGDLIFTDQREKEIKRLKLSKGSVVFFPSNFMYPHSIQPITKGTRYSIVSWLQ